MGYMEFYKILLEIRTHFLYKIRCFNLHTTFLLDRSCEGGDLPLFFFFFMLAEKGKYMVDGDGKEGEGKGR